MHTSPITAQEQSIINRQSLQVDEHLAHTAYPQFLNFCSLGPVAANHRFRLDQGKIRGFIRLVSKGEGEGGREGRETIEMHAGARSLLVKTKATSSKENYVDCVVYVVKHWVFN